MKRKYSLLSALAFVVFAICVIECTAQEFNSLRSDSEFYSVKGYRHGVSFFKKTHYQETKPLKEGELDFKHYHTYDEVVYFLKKWQKEYPDLIELYSAGKSFEGRDIPQVTLTNKKTGMDTDKPAMLIDACTHGLEFITSESCFWMLDYLLKHYGKDEEITTLIDTKALYFRILNNPDGSELILQTAQNLRSTVRPYDDDLDGLLDEDPGEDLDGDGLIRQMRKKVGPNRGDFILDPRDSSGRLMMKVEEGEGDWKVYLEGIDNDDDGNYNEDGIGGLDLHRNYPENWRPAYEATGRGYAQGGGGEFPLSEPEIRCFFLFLLTHPNISIVNSMHSEGPMHLHGPGTSRSHERVYSEDLALFHYFDREGQKITNYPAAGDMAERAATFRSDFHPYFGFGPDFGYWYYGNIWYSDELWCVYGSVNDYDNDGFYDQYDGLCWNDETFGGKGFKNWTKFQHNQLGEVEIGGSDPKFFIQNPPPQFMEEWIKKEAMFNIFLAKHLPQIEIISVNVNPSDTKNVYFVEVNFTNTGFLPTALEQAKLVRIVKPDRVRLEFDKDLTKDRKNKKVEILMPEATEKDEQVGWTNKGEIKTVRFKITPKKDVEVGWTKKGEIKKARFKVKLNGIASAKCKVHVLSTRGGHKIQEIIIGENVY